jgi:uncharacterized protein (DUF58 family)
MNGTAKYFHPETLSRITRLELRARHVVEGFLSGMHRSPYRGFSVEFAAHRPYVPGDDLRHLDWRVWAKADRHFIKEYEVETNMRVHLLVDGSSSMAYPEVEIPRLSKWDYAATVAASLAYLLAGQQDSVSLTLFDSAIRHRQSPGNSAAAAFALTEALEAHQPAGQTDAALALREAAAAVPGRGMVVIISDLLMDLGALREAWRRFRFDGHDVVVLQILDQDELTFPFEQRTRFEGIEDPTQEVMTDPQALRAAYLEALQNFLQEIEGAALDTGIDYALLSTADPVDIGLTRFLARRLHQQHART